MFSQQDVSQQFPRSGPLESLLATFCRPLDAPDYRGGTENTNLDNALDFLLRTVPQFLTLVCGKKVLDYGCGLGWQATALAERNIASSVVGLDIRLTDRARETARNYGVQDRVRFVNALPPDELFDVTYSCSSFEHFRQAEVLDRMLAATKPGGQVVVSFAEPWFSPHGAHMDGITRLPWVNLLFPERAVLGIRSRYRADGALRYEECEGGLNRMTLLKFDRIISGCGAKIIYRRNFGVKGLPWVTHLPVIRELMTSSAACVLEKP